MIYSLWIHLMIQLKSYSRGISILLLFLNIFDLVKGSNFNNNNYSQGFKLEDIRKRSAESENNFCKYENLKRLLTYTSVNNKSSSILSSNHKPLNQNSSSSTYTILLPQGNESVTLNLENISFSPIQRINSEEKNQISPLAGCINLENYNWKYKTTVNETESLPEVQMFIFQLDNGKSDKPINVDLKLLLYSTQEKALNRPIVIVLSSFLPRKFSLSALSFLSYSQQPLHIILTDSNSEVLIKDDQLFNRDISKLFISIINTDKDRYFLYSEGMNEDEFSENVHQLLNSSSLMKYGYFFGIDMNSVSTNRNNQKIWLFNRQQWFSVYKPVVKIAAVYITRPRMNLIELLIGKQFEDRNENNFTDQCQNTNALGDIINTFTKFDYFIDPLRTCYYQVTTTPPHVLGKFQTITWIHIERANDISLNIEFASTQNINLKIAYLVILTGNQIKNFKMALSSLFRNNVHILTNISLDQFDREFKGESSLLKLQFIESTGQDSTIANYILAGASTLMQTTIFNFVKDKQSKLSFQIRINIDDSKSITEVTHNCAHGNDISLSINASKWKLFGKWSESRFHLGNSNCTFRKLLNKSIQITKKTTDCSSKIINNRSSNFQYSNKVYGTWKNRKYLLKVINVYCKHIPSKKSTVTATINEPKFILKNENEILVFNNSDHKIYPEQPFYDRSLVFVQIVNLKRIFTFDLRSCYLSNKQATIDDFTPNYKSDESFKKVTIVYDGCLNESSPYYSDIYKPLRPSASKIDFGHKISRFSFGVNADRWASTLSLENQWLKEGYYEVHLYCGINVCNEVSSDQFFPLCRSKKNQCTQLVSNIIPEFKYYGTLVIAKKYEKIYLKIVTLLSLVVIIILLLLSFILICLCQSYRQRNIQRETLTKRPDESQIIDPEISFSSPRKRSINLNYHSLTLLTNPNKKYSAKLYSEPKLHDSLKRLVENCDKSIYLNAGYLTSIPNSDNSQILTTTVQPLYATKKFKIKSHSLSENSLNEPNNTNWVINSWPLSIAERKSKSQGLNNPHHYNPRISRISKIKSHQPNNSSWQPTTSSSGGSSKQKISCTLNSDLKSTSNPKVSSNRTTVSESMSANEMPSKSSSKWWTLLTNYWMNQSLVMSRN